jgi:NDP-4-keto-2,6-dideoxyhexose 3-C-methyltransferase
MTLPYKCRICSNPDLTPVIDLKTQVITSRWPTYGDWSTPATPVALALCRGCGLVQLMETTSAPELYEHDYGYRSGISNTMRQHLREYQTDILSRVACINPGDIIMDIGSNDSTMLQYYSPEYRRIGCDPTGSQFAQYYGQVELIPTYFTRDNFVAYAGSDAKCQIISSISMFYDLPDPVQFARDIYACLAHDGIWTCEQSYILSMLKTNSIDTICHEHIEYYGLAQVKRIADMSGFKIINVSFNDCNGGSFRVYFAKAESQRYEECTALIQSILADETAHKLSEPATYTAFMSRVDAQVSRLKQLLSWTKANNKRVYIYGASTKGNCLLQYADIKESDIPFAVERNLSKVGKMTSTGIPIISEETMRAEPPDYLLVLPWHFKEEILSRESAFLDAGGQFIFPLPVFTIVSKRPKVLITGASGMIARYVCQEYIADTDSGALVYAVSRQQQQQNQANPSGFQLNIQIPEYSYNNLAEIIQTIRPDILIHLAGVSSAAYSTANPLETLRANGMLTAQICDILFKLKAETGHMTSFFNAGSAEVYKGHVQFHVPEDCQDKQHIHPYSIAKAMGQDIVSWYNKTYGLPWTTGILFTIESPHKRPEFLLNKVAAYLRANDFSQPLCIGPLTSSRNILHASDCAKAIRLIMNMKYPQATYNICGLQEYVMSNLVESLMQSMNISFVHTINGYTLADGRPLILINQNQQSGFDSKETHITGAPDRLIGLGWIPKYTIKTILADCLAGPASTP